MKLLKLGDEWEIISSGEISSVWSKWKCRGEGLKKRDKFTGEVFIRTVMHAVGKRK